MAKKTSKKKTTRRKKTTLSKKKSASRSKKSQSTGGKKKKTTKSKAASVKKADTTKTTGEKGPATNKKRPTAKSSATAAAAALAAVRAANNGQEQAELVDWTDAKLRRVKTGLTRKDLNYFKGLLLEKRAEIIGDVLSLESSNSGGAGNLSNMPLHMADVGSDNYEQEFTLGLVESERKLLNEIDNAIERIFKRTYGVCLQSGMPIPYERLEIKPWAKYTIEVVRERERRGQPT